MRRIVLRVFLIALGSIAAGCSGQDAPQPVSTVLIENAVIVDGSGMDAYSGDVRIGDGRIVAVGALAPLAGETVIDGLGRVLAPGFIDTHSHGDRTLFDDLDALGATSQGITTIVVGQDGGSPYPLADFAARLEATPPAINVASYAGHNTLRGLVLGEDFRRTASADEVEQMRQMLLAELESGALGLATGLEYDPGIYSHPSEVVALAQAAADAGGRYISHVRSEDRWFFDAIDEIIDIGRATGMPVQVSHIKLSMRSLWGKAPELVAKLDAARAEGIDITADLYPYDAWQSNLMVLLPERDPTDRKAVEFVLDEIVPAEGLLITRFPPDPSVEGKRLPEIAALRETDHVSALMDLLQAADRAAREAGGSVDSMIGTSMEQADIDLLWLWEHTNLCTDGVLTYTHPRGRGSFTRVLGRYLRERRLLDLETAIRKMSGLAADHMGFADRGYIRPGLAADLVLFDPDTIIDHATMEDPLALSTGVLRVWVGGEIVFENGAATDARPGRFLRRQ
ncbi:MAG: D-aminoacylase [Gammaproteobacteria bacterium]|nr:D-aminoacylase [Gammaproteobacteria bacterium]